MRGPAALVALVAALGVPWFGLAAHGAAPVGPSLQELVDATAPGGVLRPPPGVGTLVMTTFESGTPEGWDGVVLPDGQWRYSNRVENLIKSRPEDEFRYMMENGYRRKRGRSANQMAFEPTLLVQLPEDRGSGRWR